MLPIVDNPTAPQGKSEMATQKSAQYIFFPNLNGLRFLAVMLVIMCHVEGACLERGIASFLESPAMVGQLGVTLFFVLSGFLITYLLLVEKENFGQIKFGAFYLRRAMRIWPLYYVVVVISLFVLPRINFFYVPIYTPLVQERLVEKIVLYAFMMPNVVKELFPVIPYLAQTWSIGVEEQFYLVWPVVIAFSRSYLRNFLLIALAVYVIGQLSWALTTPQRHILPINELTNFIKNFLFFFRIQCMAIGGVFALVLFRKWALVIRVITMRSVQIGVWLMLSVMIVKGVNPPYVAHELYSVLFGIVILNLALTHSSVVSLKGRVLDYLGRVSYGLYMLHAIGITVGVQVASLLFGVRSSAYHVFLYIITVLVSIVLAACSYHYLEKPFLNLKKRFARVQSG